MNIIKPFPILLLFLFLFSCSDTELTIKRITGNWDVDKLKIMDSNGILHPVQAKGSIVFTPENKKSKTGTYTIQVVYSSNTLADTLNLYGTYLQLNQRKFDFVNQNNTPFSGEMVYYTKEDLQFELPNFEYKGYYFILKKKHK